MLTHLSLQTPQPSRLQQFYTQTLGLPTQKTAEGFDMIIGHTTIRWRQAETATPYHYAINIPANQIQAALAWVQARVSVLPYKGEEIIDFQAWNAEALYFYDADHNIVELIARRNTQPEATTAFGIDQWLGVSEIGAPTTQLVAACDFLQQEAGLPWYSGDRKRFAAIGDEAGLFILLDRSSRKWMPCDDPALPSPFEARVEWAGKQCLLRYADEQWTLLDATEVL